MSRSSRFHTWSVGREILLRHGQSPQWCLQLWIRCQPFKPQLDCRPDFPELRQQSEWVHLQLLNAYQKLTTCSGKWNAAFAPAMAHLSVLGISQADQANFVDCTSAVPSGSNARMIRAAPINDRIRWGCILSRNRRGVWVKHPRQFSKPGSHFYFTFLSRYQRRSFPVASSICVWILLLIPTSGVGRCDLKYKLVLTSSKIYLPAYQSDVRSSCLSSTNHLYHLLISI